MTTEEQKILDIKVKYEDAIYGIIRYKEKIEELQKALKPLKDLEKDGQKLSNEQKLQYEALSATIKEYQSNVRALQKETQNNIKKEQEQEGSLKQLRAELSNATKAYDELSRVERNGAKGKELKAHINEITDELKGAEEATQRFYRNVGNYEGAINNAIFGNSKFGQSLQAIAEWSGGGKGLTGVLEQAKLKASALWSTLLTMFTNPYFLAMAGVAGAGMAFKWFYDYNQGIAQATRLTREFTGYTGERLQALRDEIQATADTFGKDYQDVLSSVDVLMQQYGVDGGEAIKIINDGFISGADLSGDMLQQIQNYAPAFRDAGIQGKELVAIIQQTRSGVFGKDGMDMIVKAGKSIRDMSTTTAKALDAIGISSDDLKKKLQSGQITMVDAIQQISAKLKELPPNAQEVGTVIDNVFGKKGTAAGQKQVQELANLEKSLDKVKETTGAYGKAQEEQLALNRELNGVLSSMFDMSQKGWGGMVAQAKMFGTKVLIQVLKGIRSAINYCIDWYNESVILRGAVQAIGTQFKLLWEIVKLVANLVIDAFKGIGMQAKGLVDILEGVLTLDVSKAQQGFQEIISSYGKTLKEGWKDLKSAGNGAAQAYMDGLTNTFDKNKGKLKRLSTAVFDSDETSASTGSGEGNANSQAANKNKTKKSKKETSAAQAAKTEQDEVRKAEDLMMQLVEESAEKQRQVIIQSYDRRIEDIKIKLQTEKNLTVKAREAMNQQITALEELKQRDLDKLSAEQIQKSVEFENKRIELILTSIKKGSDQERDLKIQELDNQEQLAIAQAQKDYTNDEQRQQMILAIQTSYNAKREQVEAEFYNNTLSQQQQAIQAKYENAINATTDELEQESLKLQELQTLRDTMRQHDGESEEAFAQRKIEIEQKVTNQTNALAQKRVEVQSKAYTAIGDCIGALSDIASNAGENDKGLAKLAKVLALAQIAINIGVAISKMTAAESSKGIAGIATTAAGVAAIMAQMASAISIVKSAKFATGGYVNGPGTGTSDSIPARLSNGESVMTAQATSMFSPILSAFNQLGGGVPIVVNGGGSEIGMDMLAAAVAKGYMMAPRPVVSVEEINDTNERIKIIETLGQI